MNKTIVQQHRELALTIPCTYCHAPAGQQCVNTLTQQPLDRIAAHWQRLKTAQQQKPDDEGELF